MGTPDIVWGLVKWHNPGRVCSLHSSSSSGTSQWYVGNSIQHTNSLSISRFIDLILPQDRKLQFQRQVSETLDS